LTRPAQVEGLGSRTQLWLAAETLLHARLADVRAAEARAVRRLDARTVHDLRVACRRLRAAVKLFGKKRLRALDPRIEHLQDALGALRDLQLESRWLARHRADARPLLPRVRKAEARAKSALALWTRRSEPELLRALPGVRRRGTLGGARMRKRLRKRVRKLEEALDERRRVAPEAAHRIRIAAKKLRYEAELLADAFDVGDALESLANLQTVLGELHDAEGRVDDAGQTGKLADAARRERDRWARTARAALRSFERTLSALDANL
jgi:CHAD domain-containing protein